MDADRCAHGYSKICPACDPEAWMVTGIVPSNATHHRVYMPGPHHFDRRPEIIDHPKDCDQGSCPVQEALDSWLDDDGYITVDGDYFTTDGLSFERCAWQPQR